MAALVLAAISCTDSFKSGTGNPVPSCVQKKSSMLPTMPAVGGSSYASVTRLWLVWNRIFRPVPVNL